MLKYLDPNIVSTITPIEINPEDLELIFKSEKPGLEYFKLSKKSGLYSTILNKFPEQFHNFINSLCTVGIQSIDTRFNNYLHTDVATRLYISNRLSVSNRLYTINYLLLAGGENVVTTVFDLASQNMQSYTIPLNTWYLLSTHSLYKVEGITSIRTEISINIPIINEEFMSWLNSASFSV
jgi:uncharacterized membrane protein